jgi:hemin uptake protein HemP
MMSGEGVSAGIAEAAARTDYGPPADPVRHDARALTGGGAVAVIQLEGQSCTLRITRAGKLILTKRRRTGPIERLSVCTPDQISPTKGRGT